MGKDEISFLKALAHGYGYLMGVGSALIIQWLLYYYCPPEESGLKPLAPIVDMGIVMLFGRIIDAVSDPLIGYWSDKTITRRGRRQPFIVVGFVLVDLSIVLVWIPLVPYESMVNVFYVAVLLAVFWFGYTAVFALYLALLPEVAPDREG